MEPFIARQPGKALWISYFLAMLPIRLTSLALTSILGFMRPNPRWSFKETLGNGIVRLYITLICEIRFKQPVSLESGSQKERFVNLEPAKASAYRDVLDDPAINPVAIGGMWYPKLYEKSADKDKTVVLHFHGGAYVFGGVRPIEGGWGPETIAKSVSGLSFCAQYRLAAHPNSRFPAALQDAVSAYNYLLELGIPASQIVLSGDSAGGNLAVVLLRYLQRHEGLFPLPRACLLWSPWVNLATDAEELLSNRNYHSDYIPAAMVQWSLPAFLPPSRKATDPYITQLGNEFRIRVPVFIHTGTAEVLHDNHVEFAKNLKAIPGNEIELFESQDAPHDIFGVGPLVGRTKQATEAIEAAAAWLRRPSN